MKKILLFILLLCLSLSLLCVSAFATEEVDIGKNGEDTSLGTEPPTQNVPEGENAEPTTSNEEEKTSKGNDFFTSLYLVYEENKGSIFSLLSAIVSLVLVFVYQKGLVPILKSGITLIEGQVRGLREVNTKAKEENEWVSEQALTIASQMQNETAELRKFAEVLLSRTEESEERDEEFKRMRQCILWQAKLLGEVFLSSSLPEYSKEKVGRVVADIDAMLTKTEHSEE